MTTNSIRLSISEARKRQRKMDNKCRANYSNAVGRLAARHYENPDAMNERKPGWTPAPDLAQLKRYEPVKHKGRDYEALTKAALKKPVGFWEDAPRGQAFTGVGNGSCPKTDATASKQGVAPLAPTPSTEELYEPVGTMPVAGDRVRWAGEIITVSRIAEGEYFSVRFQKAGGTEDGLLVSYFSANVTMPLRILKRKPATVEGRAYLERDIWYRVRIGPRVFFKAHPSNKSEQFGVAWHEQHYGGFMEPRDADECIRSRGGSEIHGPEAAAVIESCRQAMKL